MKRLFLAAILAIGCGVESVFGADSAPDPASSGPARQAGDDAGRSSRSGRRGGQFLERLKNQYPTEFAEIEKLRESDPDAAQNKIRELMSKSGFSRGPMRGMPPGMADRRTAEPDAETLAKLKEKYPDEFAAYEELKKTEPEKAALQLRELLVKAGFADSGKANTPNADLRLRDRGRRTVERVRAELRKRYPERYGAIEILQQTDPDAARRAFRKLFAEAAIPIESGVRQLQYEYNDSATGANGGASASGNRFGGMAPPWAGGSGGMMGPPPGMGGGR